MCIRDREIIKSYHETRNFPTTKTSEMSVHLRFGTISIRKLAHEAAQLNETYLKELIWREFFMQILYHFPKVVNESFKRKYDRILWLYDEENLKKWQEGKTGYPIAVSYTHLDVYKRQILVIGSIESVQIPENRLAEDGLVKPENLLLSGGLDAYYSSQFLEQMPYAKP